MGTPPETPATESPQIIIPARDAMPAGLSKVLVVRWQFKHILRRELETGVFLD